MSNLLVTLATTPTQSLLGFTDTYPLVAHSTATVTPPFQITNSLPAVSKWLGITFATAERFGRPIPFASITTDVVKCHEFGPQPFQTKKSALEFYWLQKEGWLNRDFVGSSENCLQLNIFVPEEAGRKAKEAGKKLPVMAWCYGGALNSGTATAIRHDATELVRIAEKEGNPVIVVTSNYRVNIFGFLSHPDLAAADPKGLCGNYGFYDQLAMFEWIQLHIHHFGGDASQVTAFGESAGAFSISALAARQSPTHLFNRVILQSGSPSTMSFRTPGYSNWDLLLSTFKLDDPSLSAKQRVEGLRKIPAEDLLEFSIKHSVMAGWGGTLQEGGIWGIRSPEQRYVSGEWEKGIEEFVLGVNEHEGSLFVGAFGGELDTAPGFDKFTKRFPDPALVHSLYPAPSHVTTCIDCPAGIFLGDMMFYAPLASLALSLSSSNTKTTIRKFHFNADLPQMSGDLKLGNHHGIEIPFIFGTRTFWKEGSDEEKTSEECMRRWASLASGRGGNGTGAEWKEWTKEDPWKLTIGPGGGEIKVEKEVLSELEEKRNDFWMKRLRSVENVAKM